MAIAHEWLHARAGSEKTFEVMAATFPDADLYALSLEPGVEWRFDRPVRTTFLDRRVARAHRAMSLPLMPLAWRTVSRQRYDVVLTSSHACAKGFRPGRAATHFSYVHTPMRYAWHADIDGRSPASGAGRAALRWWDRRSADWVDSFAVNSTEVARRVMDAYGRASTVIHPPVDTDWFTPGDAPRRHFLALGRWVAYKRFDFVVELARHVDAPFVVAGGGPEEGNLRRAARGRSNVEFVARPSDTKIRELLRGALALVFPGREDFGMVPVEAQACGTPVVALGEGGVLDTVVDGETGALVPTLDVGSFVWAMGRIADPGPATSAACRAHAEEFSVASHSTALTAWVGGTAPGGSGTPAELDRSLTS